MSDNAMDIEDMIKFIEASIRTTLVSLHELKEDGIKNASSQAEARRR
jgi:hypothetical protein